SNTTVYICLSIPASTSPLSAYHIMNYLTSPYHIRPFFFFNDTATPEIYTLSLHDALPISRIFRKARIRERLLAQIEHGTPVRSRSEEHTSELQSHLNLVCRLLLEKKKKKKKNE